jgi:hypothetical protein
MGNSFSVYILESPSNDDFFNDRSEGELLVSSLRLLEIPAVKRTIVSSEYFEKAISIDSIMKFAFETKRLPIIHISAHGDREGFELLDSTIISWEYFINYLKPINEILEENLVLCMSTCRGGYAYEMVNIEREPIFSNLIGCLENIGWRDTLVGYLTFYHLYNKGFTIKEAVNGMNKATGSKHFKHFYGEELLLDYEKKMAKIIAEWKSKKSNS